MEWAHVRALLEGLRDSDPRSSVELGPWEDRVRRFWAQLDVSPLAAPLPDHVAHFLIDGDLRVRDAAYAKAQRAQFDAWLFSTLQ